jgi:hypothetical protein
MFLRNGLHSVTSLHRMLLVLGFVTLRSVNSTHKGADNIFNGEYHLLGYDAV